MFPRFNGTLRSRGPSVSFGSGRWPVRSASSPSHHSAGKLAANIGEPEEAAALLASESLQPDDELSSAVSAFRALALADLGREREALGHALLALSKHLPRYNASLGRYAAELVDSKRGEPAA